MAGETGFWLPLPGTGTGTGGGSTGLIHVRDEKAANTHAGNATSGSWFTRTLNTVVTNTITGASLASNVITLPAGTFDVVALAPGMRCNAHKARLYDVTGAAVLINGQSEFSANPDDGVSQARVMGRFTLASSSGVRLEHRVATTTGTGFGLGIAVNFGTSEVYAEVLIRKIS